MVETAAAEDVRAQYRDIIIEILEFRARHEPSAAEYLEHGEFQTPTNLTTTEWALLDEMDETIGFEPKGCYYNSQLAALGWEEVKYVEGYVVTGTTGIPFQHAWLEFIESGHLVEVTLADHLREPELDVYYGKSFDTETIAAQQGDLGTASPLAGDAIDWEPARDMGSGVDDKT